MMKKILSLFLFFSFILMPFTVWGASSDFTIKVFPGEDTEPPTTPVMLSVVPVTHNQIDVEWSASTDNYILGGYVLLRDGNPIATTSLTSFNDTGLSSETLYSYEVYAFDSFFNISTTSNLLSTTTLAEPIVPPTPTSTPETPTKTSISLMLLLNNLEITPSHHQATFHFKTNIPARFTLRWGETNDYGKGYVSNEIYRTEHTTTVDGLQSGVNYFYELIGVNAYGASVVLQTGQFTTKTIDRKITPPNVVRLSSFVQGEDVHLSWQLPPATDIESVRVVRSPLGYPTDINDGFVVYEGLGGSVWDRGALRDSSPQFYTVFVIDKDGNVSSGAVTIAYKLSVSDPSYPEDPIIPPIVTPTSTTDREISLFDFEVNDINIFQNNQHFTFLDERISLSYRDYFVLSIPREALPRHLKSIVVTLLDPTDHRRSYSFLLRLNEDKTAYEATIAPLRVLGSSRLQIEIFDFENLLIGRYQKQVDFVVRRDTIEETEVVFPDKIVKSLKETITMLGVFGGLILLLIILWWLQKRRAEDN